MTSFLGAFFKRNAMVAYRGRPLRLPTFTHVSMDGFVAGLSQGGGRSYSTYAERRDLPPVVGASEEAMDELEELHHKFKGRQRELAAAAVDWGARNFPDSIAARIAPDLSTVTGYVGNVAAGTVGDHFFKDLPILCQPPERELIQELAAGETELWLNTPGLAGWLGSLLGAQWRERIYYDRTPGVGPIVSRNSDGSVEYLEREQDS